jgi:predicted amidohydrolase YtcJ
MSQQKADIILVNGRIFTVERDRPWAEACAIKDGRFLIVGSTEAIKGLRGSKTQVIDLKGKLVLPGFNDAHVHFFDGGYYLMGVDLRDARNEGELVERLRQYAAGLSKGEWVLGGNWDHENWPSQRHPSKELIDGVTPENPVFVHRLDTHIALCNSLALALAGIHRETPDPAGGKIEKDAGSGEPTGILKDNALQLVRKVIPPLTRDQHKRAIHKAVAHAASLGVTSIQDNSSARDIELYRRLIREGELTVRINAWTPAEGYRDLKESIICGANGLPRLRTGTVKVFADGSLGAGTALLYEPYTDAPNTRGIAIHSESDLCRLIEAIDGAGLQIAAHAIGDRAVTWVLNAFEQAFARNGHRQARHRLEHAQLVLPGDIERFRHLDIIASIEPVHCIDDMRWLERRIGTRIHYAHPFQSFIKAGVTLIFGTDWAVEPLNPMMGIYAAVSRELPEGGPAGGWFPEEKMSLTSAIEAYTLAAAYAEFQEDVKGSIKSGKAADLVVLDRDLFEIAAPEILKTKAEMTIFDGKVVYAM